MKSNLKIKIKELSKSFVHENATLDILNNLNYEFEQGIGYSIEGISGTGKTTLINLISGFEIPTNGFIFYDEQNIFQITDKLKNQFLQKYIGLVFQDSYLLNELTVIENIMIKDLILNQKNNSDMAWDLLEVINLKNKATKFPHQLSGGEQQRVSLARALFNKPNFLIADEPTAHLDKNNKQIILDLILDFKNKYNLGLIIATHDPFVARKMDINLEIKNSKLDQV